MKVFYVPLLVLVFGVVSSHGRTYGNNAARTRFPNFQTGPDEFDLVLQWPASYCRGLQSSCRRCRANIPTYFTVHGLWAQSGGSPYNCGPEQSSSCSELNPKTESNLTTYWPNLNGKDQEFGRRNSSYTPMLNPNQLDNLKRTYWPNLNGQDEGFWRHEYDTHASCIPGFRNNPYHFFSSTINLAIQHNVTKMLLNSGFPPGRRLYWIKNIFAAIHGATNFMPMLQCNSANIGGRVQLFQIYLCFDRSASYLQDCRIHYKNCPTKNWNGMISFPYPGS